MTFAEKLRELRDGQGMSEAKLAAASGVPFGTLHTYALGSRTPSFPYVVKLAKALGVSCEAFAACDDMQGDEEPPSPPAGRTAKGKPRGDQVEEQASAPKSGAKKVRHKGK